MGTYDSPYVFVRIPLYPFFHWCRGGSRIPSALRDVQTWDRALASAVDDAVALLRDPVAFEAMWLAASDFANRVQKRYRLTGALDPTVSLSLRRFQRRMSSRTTPFGTFVGVGVVPVRCDVNVAARLVVSDRSETKRFTQFDSEYLRSLIRSRLEKRMAQRGDCGVETNESCYCVGATLKYTRKNPGSSRAPGFEVASATHDKCLETLLCLANGGRGLRDLAEAMAERFTVESSEASEYVRAALDEQLLLPRAYPTLTWIEPSLGSRLRDGDVSTDFIKAAGKLREIDKDGIGRSVEQYDDVFAEMEVEREALDPGMDQRIQVDTHRPMNGSAVSTHLCRTVLKAAQALRTLCPPRKNYEFEAFKEAFRWRYGEHFVPLVVALDEEVGIGYQWSRGFARLRHRLSVDYFERCEVERESPGPFQLVIQGVEECWTTGSTVLEVSGEELERIRAERPSLPFPDAFGALVYPSKGMRDGEVAFLRGLAGPSAVMALSRFCHVDGTIESAVRDLVRLEEALFPEALFVEVVHLPQERVGNVVSRPVLRGYEMPLLGESALPVEQQIRISDLLMRVDERGIVFWSRHHNRRVIPRLSNAFNHRHRLNLPSYRFLGAAQVDGLSSPLEWRWGLLANARFLPRVVFQDVVLCRASWRVGNRGFRSETDFQSACAVADWAVEKGLPRHVCRLDDDRELVFDLDDPLDALEFAKHRWRPDDRVYEMFPTPEEFVATGPDGGYLAELLIPYVARTSKELEAPAPALSTVDIHGGASAPGWLSLKVYLEEAAADRFLLDVARTCAADAVARGFFSLWFFIRYGDPDWHLRLRFRQGEQRKVSDGLSFVMERLLGLVGSVVRRIEIANYEQEVERYGGPECIALAEEIASADSVAAIEVLNIERSMGLPYDERWRLVLASVVKLVEDFRLTDEQRLQLFASFRDNLVKEFAMGKAFFRENAVRFREERTFLRSVIGGLYEGPAMGSFLARSMKLKTSVERYREVLGSGRAERLLPVVASFAHMAANRLLREDHRRQELRIYDLLTQALRSEAARGR